MNTQRQQNNPFCFLLLALFALVWLGTGCAPYQTTQPIDPYALEVQAERLNQGAGVMRTATAQSVKASAEAEVLAVANTQAANSNQATQSAQSANATATMLTLAIERDGATSTARAQSTQEAINLIETAQSSTARADIATSTASAQSTVQALTYERERAELDRQKLYRAVGWGLVIVGAAIALVLTFRVVDTLRRTYDRRASYIETKDGTILLTDPNQKGYTVTLPAKSGQPVIYLQGGDTASPPQIDALWQALVTQRAQATQYARALFGGHFAPYPESTGAHGRTLGDVAPNVLESGEVRKALPESAEWGQFADYSGAGIPLGVGSNGALVNLPRGAFPHRLFAGGTGAGKSRAGLRPYLAGHLARGAQVVVIGDISPVDYHPFKGHENYHVLTLDDPENIFGALACIQQEIRRRLTLLDSVGASEWARLPRRARDGGRVVVCFDEFSAFADTLERRKPAFFRQCAQVARLGRKVEVILCAGIQNPTAENIRPTIKRNMTPIAYKVSDVIASRVVVGDRGAEELKTGQFIARAGGDLLKGVGFMPSDSDISDYLGLYNPQVWESPFKSWLALEGQPDQTSEKQRGADPRVAQVLDLHKDGASDTAIARAVFGHGNNHYIEKVRAIIAHGL